jgi:environmental stress-induced protein Ves
MKPSWTNQDVSPLLLPAVSRLPAPWKNGGGVSFDIALGVGRGPDGFDWRVGIAAIDQAGPFSSYLGYGRCLWLASGAGLALDFRGQPGAWIDRPGEGVQFDGGLATDCRLLRGPVRVLNFMHLATAPPTQPRLITPEFAVSGPAVAVALGAGALGAHRLGPEDAIWLPARTPPLRWVGASGALAVWLPVTSDRRAA